MTSPRNLHSEHPFFLFGHGVYAAQNSSRPAVIDARAMREALAEFNERGRAKFLTRYGFSALVEVPSEFLAAPSTTPRLWWPLPIGTRAFTKGMTRRDAAPGAPVPSARNPNAPLRVLIPPLTSCRTVLDLAHTRSQPRAHRPACWRGIRDLDPPHRLSIDLVREAQVSTLDSLRIAAMAGAMWPEPKIEAGFNQLGAFKSLSFVRVDPNGWNVYEREFANGPAEFHIAPPAPDGKVGGRYWRMLP